MKQLLAFGIITLLVTSGIALAAPGQKGAPDFVPQLTEDKLTKVVFIRYAPEKQTVCNNNGVCDPRENWKSCPKDCPKDTTTTTTTLPSSCYGFLSGAKPKWYWVEDYYYSEGLGAVSEWATSTWDAKTSSTIFGNALSGASEWGVYDYKNSIVYGDYEDQNVIAVTAIWFRGKNIYEYDIMFDTDYFPKDNIDLDTVTLHEFGHALGLDDLYNGECSNQVMYGIYGGVKTTLQSGDIAGLQILYGA